MAFSEGNFSRKKNGKIKINTAESDFYTVVLIKCGSALLSDEVLVLWY